MKNSIVMRATVMLIVILLFLRGRMVSAQSPETIGVWNVAQLREAPTHAWLERERAVHSLLYQGQPLHGRPTDVFAYFASPATLQGKQHGVDREYPGVVLIHGGGGTAFAECDRLPKLLFYSFLIFQLCELKSRDCSQA